MSDLYTDTPVVILAGGRGARFDHESQVKPKPMIEVAGKPILQHIIDSFVSQGFREFIIATGYLGDRINDWFNQTGSRFSYDRNIGQYHYKHELGGDDRYFVKCVDTGEHPHTGLRLSLLRRLLDRTFVLTYGDGLSDVHMGHVAQEHFRDYTKLAWTHYEDGTLSVHPAHEPPLVTLTAVNPPGRFGRLKFAGAYYKHVRSFEEKGHEDWINGGFMVMEPEFIDRYIDTPDCGARQLEAEALHLAAVEWRVRAYRHAGYWRCMDTRRDLEQIEDDVTNNGGELPWLIKNDPV